jgi:hypothetical protein
MSNSKRFKVLIMILLIFCMCVPIGTANAYSGAQYYSATYPYVSGTCSLTSLNCSDYYADHFDLKIYWNPQLVSNPPNANIVHAEATMTYDNQNGDKWTCQQLNIYNSSSTTPSTLVYQNSSHSSERHIGAKSTEYVTWDMNVVVPSGNNYTLGYFYYDIYTAAGSPAGTYYPKRYRLNFQTN